MNAINRGMESEYRYISLKCERNMSIFEYLIKNFDNALKYFLQCKNCQLKNTYLFNRNILIDRWFFFKMCKNIKKKILDTYFFQEKVVIC